MELYGRNSGREGSEVDPPAEWGETGLEESMWRLSLSGQESYPERPGVSDCMYYMRTGFCGFGSRCRYNHPRDRAAAVVAASLVGGEYPERPGEPLCQYYLKTGTCKFGATCKFHHPRNAGGSLTNAPLNYRGYPLRPGEKECSYYLKTGQCKFGMTCKFHHPQPAGMSMSAAAPVFYPTVQSPSVPMPEQAAGSSSGYRASRPPLVPGYYVPGTYGPVLLSPGVVPVHGWNSYSGPLSPLSPGAQPAAGAGSVYGITPMSPATPGPAGSYPQLPSSGGQSSTSTQEHKFPERPGQPECQYYMRTGNCKFGASCRYHHPPNRAASATAAFLGPQGLPLRPGAQPCTFYMQNGYCKFGPTCKFDHPPVGMMKYSPSASSLTETPVAPYMAGSTLATLPPSSLSPDIQSEYGLGSQRDPQSNRTISSSGNASVGLTLSKTTSSALLSSSRSMGGDEEVSHSS